MKNRIQKLPAIMHIGDQNDKRVGYTFVKDGIPKTNRKTFSGEIDEVVKFVNEYLPEPIEKETVKEFAEQYHCSEHEFLVYVFVAICESKGVGVAASTFVEEDGQSEVFTFSEAGCYADMIYNRSVMKTINRTKELVFGGKAPDISAIIRPKKKSFQTISQNKKKETTAQMQTISRKEGKTRVVFVWYPEQNKEEKEPYAFKCRMEHKAGDCVVVMSGSVPTNVEVAYYREMCNDEVKALAAACNRKDLSWVESDKPL